MADQKISELTALTGANVADDDAIAIVDTSATETKKIVFSELKNALDTATGFVRITGDTMTGDLSMGDNVKAIFGAGSDLQIYHDGSNSYIDESGTGSLSIRTNLLYLEKYTGEAMLTAVSDGAVTIYHDNAAKLATTSTGIDVTGTVTADGLTSNKNINSTTIPTARSDYQISVEVDGAHTGDYVGGIAFGDQALSTAQAAILIADRGASAATGLSIATGNSAAITQRMRIDDIGDISFYEDTGSTPKFFWDASAEALQLGSTTSDESSLFAYKSSATYPAITVRQDGSAPIQKWLGASGAERMRIDSSGNVGIGTSVALTGPSAATALRIGNQINIYEYDDGSNPVQMNIDQNIDANENYITTDHAARYQMRDGVHKWFTVGSGTAGAATNIGTGEAMRIDSSGKVLVGFDNTAYANGDLVVGKGTASGNSTLGIQSNGSANLNKINFGDGSRGDRASIISGSTNYLAFSTFDGSSTTQEAMRIDSSGHAIIPAGVTLGTAAGVYAAANTLDDYEEGTFTYSGGSANITSTVTSERRYIKIGNQVTLWLKATFDVTAADTRTFLSVTLPFNTATNTTVISGGGLVEGPSPFKGISAGAGDASQATATTGYWSFIPIATGSHSAWLSLTYESV